MAKSLHIYIVNSNHSAPKSTKGRLQAPLIRGACKRPFKAPLASGAHKGALGLVFIFIMIFFNIGIEQQQQNPQLTPLAPLASGAQCTEGRLQAPL